MKKYFCGAIAASLFLVGIVQAQVLRPTGAGALLAPDLWIFSGTSLLPQTSTWHVGSSAVRIAKGWFTDLDATTMTVGGAVTGPMLVSPTGTAAAPAYSFNADSDTGLFSDTANSLSVTTGGTKRFTIDGTNTSSTLAYIAPIGTQSLPSYSFNGDTDSGFYQVAVDRPGITAGGGNPMSWQSTVTIFQGSATVNANNLYDIGTNSAALRNVYVSSTVFSATSTIFNAAAGATSNLTIQEGAGQAAGAVDAFTISNNAGTKLLQFSNILSSQPVLNMTGNAYGIFYNGQISNARMASTADSATSIPFVARGAAAQTADLTRWQNSGNTVLANITSGGAVSTTQQLFTGQGSVGAPSISFATQTNLGIWSSAANILDFSTVGVDRLQVNSTNVSSTLAYLAPLGSVGLPAYSFNGDTNNGMWSSAADTINFSTAGLERMRIGSGGSVGIGTDTPSSTFHVWPNVSGPAATTTITFGASFATRGSCVKLKDVTGTGFTYMTVQAGVATFSTTSCE